jgi:hypothetical protein
MAGRSKESVRHFVRLAGRRLSYAEFLLQALLAGEDTPEGLANLAIENAAMAVECALKGLLLASNPSRGRGEVETSFRGSAPHRPVWLAGRLKDRGVSLSRPIIRCLSRLDWWEYERRYDLRVIRSERASQYVADAILIVQWALERI